MQGTATDWLTGKEGTSILVRNLDNAVKGVKNKEEWRLEYMTLLMRDQEMIQKGREEGRKEGRIDALKDTAIRMSKKGRSIEEIADCVDSDVETVKKWITAWI